MSISAQSCASVPPAPAWISTIAGSGSSSCVSLNVSSLWRAHGRDRGERLVGVRLHLLARAQELREDLELVLPFLEVLVVREDALGALQLAQRLLRLECVRPEAGLARLPLELFFLFRRLADVKDSPGGRSRTTRVRAGAQFVLRSRGTSSRRRTVRVGRIGQPAAAGSRGSRSRARRIPATSPAVQTHADRVARGRRGRRRGGPLERHRERALHVGAERHENAARFRPRLR